MQVAALTGSVGRIPGFARSEAAETAVPAQEARREPYLSPVFRFDKQAGVVVFQFRDSETGDVTKQWPSERVVKLYRENAPPPVPSASTDKGAAEPEVAASDGNVAPAKKASTPKAAASPSASGAADGDRIRLTA